MMNNENMLPVGTMLRGDTYEVKQQLASGGFGNTYLVQNVRFNETYAMKEFFMRGVNLREGDTVTVSVPDNKATFESQKTKLMKEAQRLRKLHNPHIVQVHDLFEERGTVYYVMDYIEGESLGSRLQRTGKPLTEAEATDVLRQMLDALELVHSQSPQLLHLDIKPANIMVDGSGCAYLIDFGASKQIATDDNNALSTTTGMSYTAGYAPSEQIEQNYERMGPWTDFYALGATLYKLVTMQQPPSPSRISEEKAGAFSFPATVSERFRQLICWMMTPNRTKRPQKVVEIRQYLQEGGGAKAFDTDDDDTTFYGGTSLSGRGKAPATPQTPPPTRKPIQSSTGNQNFNPLYIIAGIVVVLGIVLAVWHSSQNTGQTNIDVPDTAQVEAPVVDSVAPSSTEQQENQIQEEASPVTEEESQDNIKHYGHDLSAAQHHHLVGYFYDNNNRKWPVQLDFNSGNDQITNVVYRNVGTGGRISMTCTSFNGTDMQLVSRDGSNLSMSLEMNGAGEFSGMATQGGTTLNVSLSPQCSH